MSMEKPSEGIIILVLYVIGSRAGNYECGKGFWRSHTLVKHDNSYQSDKLYSEKVEHQKPSAVIYC